jgi:hypothetical protein
MRIWRCLVGKLPAKGHSINASHVACLTVGFSVVVSSAPAQQLVNDPVVQANFTSISLQIEARRVSKGRVGHIKCKIAGGKK